MVQEGCSDSAIASAFHSVHQGRKRGRWGFWSKSRGLPHSRAFLCAAQTVVTRPCLAVVGMGGGGLYPGSSRPFSNSSSTEEGEGNWGAAMASAIATVGTVKLLFPPSLGFFPSFSSKGRNRVGAWEDTVRSHCWACRLYYSLRWCEVGSRSPFMTDGDTEAEHAMCGRVGLALRLGLPGSVEGTIAWAPGFDSLPVSSPKSVACIELPVCTALR